MNIYVCLKQVPDTEASIILKEEKAIQEANIKWIINPYDEFAIEEALKLKEKVAGSTVTAICLGPERAEQALRSALAMGCDRAVHLLVTVPLDDQAIARALAKAIQADAQYGIVFMGKQAIDNDAYVTHIYLAEILGIPVATNVTVFNYQGDKVLVERESEGGAREVIAMHLPCVVAASKGLNTPRYASMMGIMKAKKMEIKKIALAETGISESDSRVHLRRLSVPPEKPQGRIISGGVDEAVVELVRLLREEAKVL